MFASSRAAEYGEWVKERTSAAQSTSFGWNAASPSALTTRIGGEQFDKTGHKMENERGDHPTLAEEEERTLRCLGAAVIMQWNTLPTKLQKELFDNASSMGDLLQTDALKGQIAQFLHQHKDDGAGHSNDASRRVDGKLSGNRPAVSTRPAGRRLPAPAGEFVLVCAPVCAFVRGHLRDPLAKPHHGRRAGLD